MAVTLKWNNMNSNVPDRDDNVSAKNDFSDTIDEVNV